jgi:glycosyltransferase involved in cell wall biosynthesis
MTAPGVSVVIPAYNYARYLPRALDSVLRQTFQDIEILIIDDGSTDNTPDVVRDFLADPRVRYHRIRNNGPSRARNVGIGLARAELVAFLDADDAWMPTKLEKQLALFRRRPSPGVVYTRRRLVDAEGFELESVEPTPHRGQVLQALLGGNFLCLTSCMVSRRVFETVGTFDEALSQAEDYDLWLRAAQHFRFDFVDEPLVSYRFGHTSLSRHTQERLQSVVHILRRFLKQQGGQSTVLRSLVRKKLAATYSDCALAIRDRQRLRALTWYVRGLWTRPTHGPAWLGLGSVLLPECVRRLLRRALGQPLDWRRRRRVLRDSAACDLALALAKPEAAEEGL